MIRRFLILIILFIVIDYTFGQKDTEFWFVAPAISRSHCSGTCPGAAPVSFVFTTFDQPATVTISQPANSTFNNSTNIVINMAANSVHREVLWTDNYNNVGYELESQRRKDIENRLDPSNLKQKLNKGIQITATNYITAYYIDEEPYNSDIFALKGMNAVGKVFYAPFQRNKLNGTYAPDTAYSAIDIVAVEDGTEVWIYPTDSVRGWGNVDSFKIDLDRGETYSVIPGSKAGKIYRDANRRLSGTKIVAKSGRIAVTIKDDSVNGDSGCYDILGDQLIPVEAYYNDDGINNSGAGTIKPILGSEYIVMKGNLGAPTNLDRIYIVATKDGTDISIKDSSGTVVASYLNLDEQDQVTYAVKATEPIVYVASDDIDKPVCIFHVTGGGGGCEIGGAILPAISLCTGSFQVGFMRDQPVGTKEFFMNVMARDGALSTFLLNNNPIFTDTTKFIKIKGTSWWAGRFDMTSSITPNTQYVLENTKDIFHLGTLHGGSGNGGNYGYFSNYAVIEAQSYVEGEIAQPGAKICYGDTKQLVANGGISYVWTPSTYLSDPYVSSPLCTPLSNIKYKVIVTGATCIPADTAYIDIQVSDPLTAYFTVENPEGCAPFTAKFDNQSVGGTKFWWYFTTDTMPQSYAKEPGSFIFNNTTDSVIEYEVIMYAQNKICIKSFSRTITVYPQIDASFSVDTFQGCEPLTVVFNDNSTGNLDKFFWEFGDGNGILDTIPTYTGILSHTYTNRSNNDTSFSVWLVTESPFLCRDSMKQDIIVHPYIDVKFGADTVTRCSPFTVNVYNNSLGVASYNLDFGDGKDTSMLGFNYLMHTYVNTGSTIRKDTMILIGTSTQGCTDTFRRLITIYPEINSQFSSSSHEICDSSLINFSDLSYGYDYSYFWDFGDGNTSVQTNPSHVFRNTIDRDTSYIISLKLESPYCTDYSYDTINVHNIVNAGYTYSIEKQCTPVVIRIDPTNTKGDSLYWDFNGDFITDSVMYDHNVFYKTFDNTDPSNDIYYNMRLRVSNYNCSDSLIRPLIIKPQVVADINSVSALNGCSPINITFGNLSLGGDLQYNWDFSDGTSSSDSIPLIHTFNNTTLNDKSYKVSLTATHPVTNCSSKDSVTLTVYPFINAGFTMSNTEICTPFEVTFTNTSTKITNESYVWYITGGFSSTSTDIIHKFENNTQNTILNYQVSLIAYNSLHLTCADTSFNNVVVYPKVIADFTPDITTNCNPLTVNFSENSFGYGLKYYWDFNDGTHSSMQIPAHTFINYSINDKTFNVNLQVTDTNNCIDDTTIQITVYPNVSSDFSVSYTETCTPFIVNLTNNSSKATGEIYQWDLGDLIKTTTTDVVHEYHNNTKNTIQNYQISLRSYLSVHPGCADTSYYTLTVYPKVTALFTPDITLGCHPLEVSFSQNSNGFGLDYLWDFDDGTTSSLINPIITFENFNTSNKTFNVSLTVTDDQACSDDTVIQVTVNPYVNASYTYTKQGNCTPFYIQLDASNSKGNRFVWDYEGNGTNDETRNTKTAFSRKYDNTLPNSSLTVYPRLITYYDFAANCTDTMNDILIIPPRVIASFTPDNLAGCQPFLLGVTNGSTGGSLTYDWDFGDSTSSSSFEPSHLYYNYSSMDVVRPVTLRTVSDNSCEDDTTINITVYSYVESDFKTAEAAKCSPFAVSLTNSSRGGITAYKWSFGDGGTSTLINPAHTYYNTSGIVQNRTIRLEVNNIHGCSHVYEDQVRVYPQVVPSYDVTIEGCHPMNVQFDNNTKYARDYEWTFGDGSSSLEEDPEHLYNNFDRNLDSIFHVNLKAYSSYECLSEKDTLITVHPKPLAIYDVSNSVGCPPFDVSFTNHSVGSQLSYAWNFGDGQNDSQVNTIHTFLNTKETITEYDVVLITSTLYGCSDTMLKAIRVYPEVSANYTSDKKSGCSPLTVNFTNLSENQDYSEWDFDNGLYSSVNNPEHRFVNSGNVDRKFVVRLSSRSDYNCFSEAADTIIVFPSPSTEFAVEPTHQMYIPEPDVEITNWSNYLDTWQFIWDFGDGTTSNSNEEKFSKEYTIWGSAENDHEIPITLKAVNSLHPECYTEKTHSIRIIPPVPEISINGDDPEGCVPFEVNFSTVYNYVHPNGFIWDFDDGSTSNEPGPIHIFEEAGVYNVKLEVVGDGGRNYDYKTVVVNPKPEAAFVIEPSIVMLPALGEKSEPIYCYNQSRLGETFLWEFGDGNTSTEKEPVYTYDTIPQNYASFPVYYDIKLTVWSEFGCVDSLTIVDAVQVDAAGVVKFPNAFTPNINGPSGGRYTSDIDNSVFHPYSDGVIEYRLEIFTRWGENIFASEDVNIGWDGYVKGELARQGVYIWKVWVRFVNNEERVYYGDVTVLYNDDQVTGQE